MAASKAADQGAANDRRANFVRIAEKRVGNAIKAIRLVGNLSNRAAYEFNEADVKKIAAALSREVDGMQRRFTETPAKSKIEFKL
jgi:hypothetical protein